MSFGEEDGPALTDAFHCTGTEPHLWNCPRSALGAAACPPHHVAYAICSGESAEALRLQGGQSRCDGRVEIFLRGAWGRIVAEAWGLAEAGVVCRQLRCGEARRAYSLDPTARGPEATPVGLSTVTCAGNETRLTQCQVSTPPLPPAGTAWDVGVICSGEFLPGPCPTPGSGPSPGSMPSHGPTPGSSPDQGPTLAIVPPLAMSHIPIPTPGHIPPLTVVPRPTPDYVPPPQSHPRSYPTPDNGPTLAIALLAEMAPLLAERAKACVWRAARGAAPGGWRCSTTGAGGTVCNDSWDLADAQVVCRQLSCGVALGAPASAGHGARTGPIWLDELGCTGNESRLWQCPYAGWGQHDCRHKEDVGVLCSGKFCGPRGPHCFKLRVWPLSQRRFSAVPLSPEYTDVRLAGGSWACTGRLEVFYNGTWGSVCHNSLTDVSLTVICKQLQCGARGQVLPTPKTEAESRLTWVDRIECREKHHISLWQCPSAPWHPHSCPRTEEAWISCRGDDLVDLSPPAWEPCGPFQATKSLDLKCTMRVKTACGQG
ncbi:scavenger receptor cysteine-rich domain-containing group B protein-like [Tachyglossus aculeatus]|uniref:scavenger receptor cysteine-rich domain-containing group B protein-like n=1 Tax=Tachyglossus aculeatus TaxID=9261 RepID=UPI0018F77AD9|nr:scavenger receptor cysteine-rich domain-containing group B protein-like [Tachyglossus aculeatus]